MCHEKMKDLIYKILDLENEMREKARSCIDCSCILKMDEINTAFRLHELETWSLQTLENYLNDLISAQLESRNLLCERYAYKLQKTDPERYHALKEHLPEASVEKLWLVDLICSEQIAWIKTTVEQDQLQKPSAQTANIDTIDAELRSELMTYSIKTLRSYAAHLEELLKNPNNIAG